jgi:ankyrin repeat protein
MTRTIPAGALALALAVGLGAWLHAAAPSPVADAAMRQDVDTVRQLLRQGVDVNAAQGDGMTALHWAATHGDAALVDVLLYAGANVKATSRLGRHTALHVASQGTNAAVVRALIARGADVNAATSTGATPLMFAAQAGQAPIVAALLAADADLDAVENAHGQTALMFAAAYDRADVVSALLTAGAKPDVTSKVVDLAALATEGEGDGRPPEPQGALAEQRNRAGGAPANRQATAPAGRGGGAGGGVAGATRPYRYNELIGAQGGLSALHYAARQGAAAAARTIVERGGNVNLRSPGDGTTPILIATLNGHYDLAKYFLEHGADPNLTSKAGAGPLYAALNVQWAPVAAYPQPRAHLQQRTPYLELVKLLLDKGADPNQRLTRKVWYSGYNFDQSGVDEIGATPFWRAAYASDVPAMKLLVSYGADPHLPSVRPAERTRGLDGLGELRDVSDLPPVPVGGPGVPPLHAVAGVGYGKGFAGNSHVYSEAGMLAAVKYLVEEIGADVNALDYEGNTVVHHAASRGDLEMIQYLVAKGADVTRVNRAGQSTVDLANGPVQRVQPFPETMKYLESLGAKNNHKCVSC